MRRRQSNSSSSTSSLRRATLLPLYFQLLGATSEAQADKTSLARTISGAAPGVVDPWWSSKGSRLQKSNFVLHRSPLPHETALSTRTLRAFRRAPFLCALPQNKSLLPAFLAASPGHSFALTVITVICRAITHSFGDAPHRFLPAFNLRKARVTATTGGFLLTVLSNARRAPCLRVLLCANPRPINFLRNLGVVEGMSYL